MTSGRNRFLLSDVGHIGPTARNGASLTSVCISRLANNECLDKPIFVMATILRKLPTQWMRTRDSWYHGGIASFERDVVRPIRNFRQGKT
jgi:hypothetical protein